MQFIPPLSKTILTKKNKTSFYLINFAFLKLLLFALAFSWFFSACSGSKRFTSEEEEFYEKEFKPGSNSIRVLLDENPSALFLTLQSKIDLYNGKKKVAEIYSGNVVKCYSAGENINIKIGRQNFFGKYFQIVPAKGESIVKFNGKSYRGGIRIVPDNSTINLINFIGLHDYLKGVIAKEMPLGKNDENFEALKAFAITARTYAVNKLNEGKLLFDIFPDTRDQVYGGVNAENSYSNKAVDATKGMILIYDDKPAIVYYHSTCGGFTESVENVFPRQPLPYLISIKDGGEPFCKISPRYEWKESYTEEQFIDDLFNAKLIGSKNFNLEDISIESKFPSGRVENLKIVLRNKSGGMKEINLYGNDIRTKIKTVKRNLSLWSTLFNINFSDGNVTIEGHGFGHGVGLCQWGAIGQSRKGADYKEILRHYFPGTQIGILND